MRSNIVIKNLKWGLVYQFINMFMGFITPRFIMVVYGSEINGLQNSIMQIINIIALLQAGVTSASVFLMYKPLAEERYTDVSELLYSAVLYFRKIAMIFFVIMLIAATIFTVTMNSSLERYEVFISFLILGLKSTMDILLVSRYLIIFTADQNKYIISIANILEKVVYYVLLFVIISMKFYFVFMYLGLVIGTLAKIVLYKSIYNKMYKDKLKIDKKNFRQREITGKNHSMMNEVSHTVVVSSIMIIVSSLYDLKAASVCSVYYLVISLFTTIDVVIYESFSSSFGHLVAEGNDKKINFVFAVFQLGFNMLNTFLYMCAAYLIVPFIQIYTKGVTDVDYQNYFLAVMIIIFGIMYTYRIPYNICVSTHGLFSQTSTQPVVCCIVSIVVSILLGKMRMELVIMGPILFYIVNYLYQIIKLKKLLPSMDFDHPIKQFLASIGCIVFSLLFAVYVPLNNIGIIKWILTAIITCGICGMIVVVTFLSINHERFIEAVNYAMSIVRRRFKR